MKTKTYLIALAVAAFGIGASAHAQVIVNGDFDAGGSPSLTGWTGSGAGAVNGSSALAPDFGGSAPSSTDLAFVYHTGYISQALTFLPDTEYTLTVEVASRGDIPFQTAAPYYIIDDGDSTTPTPDSSNPDPFPGTLGASNFADPVTNSFQTETITFTTTTGGLGYVEFGNNYGGTPSAYDDTADFTHVTLSGVTLSMPEPAAWTLAVAGLLGLAFVLRRGTNRS